MGVKRIFRIVYRSPQIFLGIVICKIPFLAKYKKHLLSTWQDSDKRTQIDNFLFPYTFNVWIKFEYLKEVDPDKREELKALAMGGNSGKKWAECYDTRPLDFNSKTGHLTFREVQPLFDEVEDICKNSRTDLVVIQVGSSSGRETAYFASKYPEFEFIGTDIYQEVIAYSSQSHNLPNLSFVLLSAKDISKLIFKFKEKNILIYASGSLQYVQPEHLKYFFEGLNNHNKLEIVISEPGNESKGKPDELNMSIWRGNFSYTHDYKYYAEKSGIETAKCEIIRPYFPYEDFPEHKNTVHYFYYGRSKK